MPSRRGLKPLMIDANLALYALNPTVPVQRQVLDRFAAWHREGRAWYAPHLWRLEVASGLRKMVRAGMLSETEAQTLLDLVFSWEITVIPVDEHLLRQAFAWSGRLRDWVIYDSVYLALAEHLGAEFWTADRRLYRRAREAGAEFVHLFPLGEERG